MMPKMSAPSPDLVARLSTIRSLTVSAVFAMVLLCLAWELILAPTGGRTLALKAVPWAASLFGLMRHRLYTYRWLSLLVWLYIAEGLVRLFGREGGWVPALSIVEIGLSMVVFALCVAHVRLRLKHAPEQETSR
jgi:uncharacterized membrane protein